METFLLIVSVALAFAVAACVVLIGRLSGVGAGPGGGPESLERAVGMALDGQGEALVRLADVRYSALQERSDATLAQHSQSVHRDLAEMAERLAALERQRQADSDGLRAVVADLADAHRLTRDETARLATAMRDHRVRGTWGEVQLRRVLELSGMAAHADFVEQAAFAGGAARPDVLVRLPNSRAAVVDAKAPLDAYLAASAVDDIDERDRLHRDHAKAVGAHVTALAGRRYTEIVPDAVELVLLFLPGDHFLATALDADAALFDRAARVGVLLVTPTSLLAVLRAVAVGWREQRAADTALEIVELGRELHERLGVFAEHLGSVGTHLDRAVTGYNRAVGSFDSRVACTARKLAERGVMSGRGEVAVAMVDSRSRPLLSAP
ncbi:MAG: DNA recombination protein RmuC [Microthrixaceae bacterium]